MILTPHRPGVALVAPGPEELAYMAELNLANWSGRVQNPRRKGPLPVVPPAGSAAPIMIPHFWTGQEVPTLDFKKRAALYGSNTYVIYEGPSELTGEPIVVIAVGFRDPSSNVKTGNMVQTYVIRSDIDPQLATLSGQDEAVCGDCALAGPPPMRQPKNKSGWSRPGRLCYVDLMRINNQIYKPYKKGVTPRVPFEALADLFALVEGLRIGSFGEPTAVPEKIWRECLRKTTRWTGYTHQWNKPRFQGFRDFCMASVDTPEEAVYAQRILGWSTYRLGGPADPPMDELEVVCLFEPESGLEVRLQCDSCGLCTGRERVVQRRAEFGDTKRVVYGPPRGIVDPVHGQGARGKATSNYQRFLDGYEGFTSPEGTYFPVGYFREYVVSQQQLWVEAERRRVVAAELRRKKNPGYDARLRAEGRDGSNVLARMRAGEVSQEQVEFAASLGRPDALELFPDAIPVDWWRGVDWTEESPFGTLVSSVVARAVTLVGVEPLVLFALDCAEYVLPAWERPARLGGAGRLSGGAYRRGQQQREREALAPRRLIQEARRYVFSGGTRSEDALRRLKADLEEAIRKNSLLGSNEEWQAAMAARAAADSALLPHRDYFGHAQAEIELFQFNMRIGFIQEASRYALHPWVGTGPDPTAGVRDVRDPTRPQSAWQNSRLAAYVLGEVQIPRREIQIPRRNPINPGHDHPRVRYPRSRDEIHDQLHAYREQAGLPGHVSASWPSSLSRLHETNSRRYAQVYFPGGERVAGSGEARYEFAEQARWLPARNLRGLVAHEVGHELAGAYGSEEEADAAAERALGVKIGYDRRWPGKGLQRARNPDRTSELMDQAGRALALARQHNLRAAYVDKAAIFYDQGLAALEGLGLGALDAYAHVPGVREKVASGKFITSIGEVVTAIRIKHENVSQLGSAPPELREIVALVEHPDFGDPTGFGGTQVSKNPWEWQRGPGEGAPYPSVLSGPEVVQAMRKYGVTIRDLARGLQTTMKRVRHVREHGVTPCVHGRRCRGCVQTWLDKIVEVSQA